MSLRMAALDRAAREALDADLAHLRARRVADGPGHAAAPVSY